ncbi:Hypothetical protein, putative [Bodo saltans]|uniref:Uncharacterized protein n=1 Tax=Bodo saltans TaxID=75058 RepID=A0A0S4JQ70_BODSA|nr:Hypothetical protein, putative [Bodo saltans]|eukprot:CUG92335.1 Hypothetical protein, putative [Bodo saltans]
MSDATGDAGLNTQLADVHNEFMTALVNTGLLGKLRAQLRAAAVAIIDDDKVALRTLGSHNMKTATDRSKIALLLIEDFLQSNTMKHSLGVFVEESNVGSVKAEEREQLLNPIQQRAPGGAAQSSSLLETLIGLALAPVSQPPTSTTTVAPQHSASTHPPSAAPSQRAPSPDIEFSTTVPATLAKKEASSVGATSSGGSRRGSASAPADPLDDSVEYSDRSANSSLDLTNCLAVDRVAVVAKAATATRGGGGESTSDDDF